MRPCRIAVPALLGLVLCARADAAQPDAARPSLSVSPELLEQLRSEMRELLKGVQLIGMSLPLGDWTAIAATGEQMRKSYLLEKHLTKAQRAELEKLPETFKVLDEQLHLRAEKLAHAASERDAEQVSFHYGRLLETCTSCHAAYAQQRFAGFAAPASEPHHH